MWLSLVVVHGAVVVIIVVISSSSSSSIMVEIVLESELVTACSLITSSLDQCINLFFFYGYCVLTQIPPLSALLDLLATHCQLSSWYCADCRG
jgi:hypothetical protein